MKIIKHGIIPENRVYRVSCPNCATEFEFEQHEAKMTHEQRDGDFLTIPCPVCFRAVHIDAHHLSVLKEVV
jgi:endogenous inhibitor of DNA gyrase (YacG/DUF329 family)